MAEGIKLATAHFELIPSMRGSEKIIRSEFSDVGTQASKSFGGTFSSGLKRVVGPAVALAGAAAVGKFVGDSLKSLQRIEVINAQTASAIKATGGSAKVTSKQITQLTDSLEAQTSTEAETIQQGANLLLTFKKVRNEVGKNNRIFDRATTAAVDLSRSGFGSVESASILLGKALNDPVKGIAALGRSGVTFTKEQKETIKRLVETNKTLEAQKLILKEVEGQVGGAGEAYRQTTAGKLEQFEHQIGAIGEEFATAMLPTLEKTTDYLLDKGIPAFRDFVEDVTPIAKDIGPALSGTLSSVGDALKVVVPLATSAINAFLKLPKPIQAAIVAGLVGGKLAAGAAGLLGVTAGDPKKDDGKPDKKRSKNKVLDTLKKTPVVAPTSLSAGAVGAQAALGIGTAVGGAYAGYKSTRNVLEGFARTPGFTQASAAQRGGSGGRETSDEVKAAKSAYIAQQNAKYEKEYAQAIENARIRQKARSDELIRTFTAQKSAVDKVTYSVKDLGNQNPKPKVDAIGLTTALSDFLNLGRRIDTVGDKTARPKVQVEGLPATFAALGRVGDTIEALARKSGKIKAGNNANGTDFWRGGLTWVGERGPELVNLNRGAQVFTAQESRRIASQSLAPAVGGSTGQRITGTLRVDPSTWHAEIDGIVLDHLEYDQTLSEMTRD